MPTTFPTISALLTSIQDRIHTNGAQEISGQVHQDVLVDLVLTIADQLAQIAPDVLAMFPAWSDSTTYVGGEESVVTYGGKLYLFVSSTDDLATQPGTNSNVWKEVSALELAHFRNTDQALDEGGPYEVTAQQLYGLLTNPKSRWLDPVEDVRNTPTGSEGEGERYLVGVGTGAFAGKDDNVVEKKGGVWVETVTLDGDVVRIKASPGTVTTKDAGVWTTRTLSTTATPTIQQVVAAGADLGSLYMLQTAPTQWAWGGVSHYTPGDFTPPWPTYAHALVAVGANMNMRLPSGSFFRDFVLHLYNATGTAYSITWQSGEWIVNTWMPNTIQPGEHIFVYVSTQANGDPGIVTSSSRSLGAAAFLAVDTSAGLTTNSNAYVPGVAALRTYVANALAALVASAPGTLDTLNEFAAALGNDPSFATSMATALAGKQPLDSVLTVLAGASANGQSLVTAANYASMRTLLGLVIGTNVQAYNVALDYFSALTPAANKLAYYDTTTSMALANVRAMGLSLLGSGTAGDVYTALALTDLAKAMMALVTPGSDSFMQARTDGTLRLRTIAQMLTDLGAGSANGLATLDSGGKVPTSQLPAAVIGAVAYQGAWDAATNTPAIPAASSGNKGYYYKSSGTVGAGHGYSNVPATDFAVGDWIISNGTSWDKVDNSEAVTSVAGRLGAVTLTSADLTDSSANSRAMMSAANYAAMRTLLGLVIGTDVQAYHSNLGAIAALTLASGKMIRWTGASTATTQDISATPANSTVPISDGSGKLDGWVSDGSTSTKGKVQLASNGDTTSARAVCGDDWRLPTRTYLSSDLSPSSSTTLADITGLGQSVVANGIYEVEIEVIFQTAAATTGVNISVNGPASPDTVLLRRVCRTSAGQTTSFIEAYDAGTATSDIPVSGTSYICNLKGTFINGANAGTFIPRFASEVGGSNVTPKKGSWMKLTRIA